MELPSDIAYLDVEVPGAPLVLAEPASAPERLRSCAGAIAGRLSQAKSPAILVDQDVDRYGAAAEVVGLAERLQMPVAVTGPAKAVIDETFPYYAGIYNWVVKHLPVGRDLVSELRFSGLDPVRRL